MKDGDEDLVAVERVAADAVVVVRVALETGSLSGRKCSSFLVD